MQDRVIAMEDPAVEHRLSGSANRIKIQPNKLMDPPTNMIILDCAGGETIVSMQEEIAAVADRAVSYSILWITGYLSFPLTATWVEWT